MSKRLFSLLLEVPSSMVRATRELISRGLSHIPLASALGSSPKKPLSPNTGEGSSLSYIPPVFCLTCGGPVGWFICATCKRLKHTSEMARQFLCKSCHTYLKRKISHSEGGKNFQEGKVS